MTVIVVIASSARGFTTPRDGTPPVINPCPSTQAQDEKASVPPRCGSASSRSSAAAARSGCSVVPLPRTGRHSYRQSSVSATHSPRAAPFGFAAAGAAWVEVSHPGRSTRFRRRRLDRHLQPDSARLTASSSRSQVRWVLYWCISRLTFWCTSRQRLQTSELPHADRHAVSHSGHGCGVVVDMRVMT
jgi:hypothetical protein